MRLTNSLSLSFDYIQSNAITLRLAASGIWCSETPQRYSPETSPSNTNTISTQSSGVAKMQQQSPAKHTSSPPPQPRRSKVVPSSHPLKRATISCHPILPSLSPSLPTPPPSPSPLSRREPHSPPPHAQHEKPAPYPPPSPPSPTPHRS